MTLGDILEIRIRHGKATKGPWRISECDQLIVDGGDEDSSHILRIFPAGIEKESDGRAKIIEDEDGHKEVVHVIDDIVEADLEFVLHAWDDIKHLLDYIDSLQSYDDTPME